MVFLQKRVVSYQVGRLSLLEEHLLFQLEHLSLQAKYLFLQVEHLFLQAEHLFLFLIEDAVHVVDQVGS